MLAMFRALLGEKCAHLCRRPPPLPHLISALYQLPGRSSRRLRPRCGPGDRDSNSGHQLRCSHPLIGASHVCVPDHAEEIVTADKHGAGPLLFVVFIMMGVFVLL